MNIYFASESPSQLKHTMLAVGPRKGQRAMTLCRAVEGLKELATDSVLLTVGTTGRLNS